MDPIADYFGSWLFGLIADTSWKWLVTRARGQALQKAGDAQPQLARAHEGIGLCEFREGQREHALRALGLAQQIYQASGSPGADRITRLIDDLGA